MWETVLIFVCLTLIARSYYKINLRFMFNKIVFKSYFSIIHIGIVLLLVIWPFPILNGRNVKNGRIWGGILKHSTILYGVKWELRNCEVLSTDNGAVIVANHQSSLDVVGICHVWGIVNKMSIIAKKELLYTGPWAVMTYFAGLVFIDRSNPKNAYAQLETAVNFIHNKIKIWFFPEGTRNFDQTQLLPFKRGAFKLAVIAQAPIIPLVISPYYFIDRKNYKFNKGRAIIQCLEEVPTTGLTMDDVPELIERVRNMMLAAYKELSDEVLTYAPNLGNKLSNIKQL